MSFSSRKRLKSGETLWRFPSCLSRWISKTTCFCAEAIFNLKELATGDVLSAMKGIGIGVSYVPKPRGTNSTRSDSRAVSLEILEWFKAKAAKPGVVQNASSLKAQSGGRLIALVTSRWCHEHLTDLS